MDHKGDALKKKAGTTEKTGGGFLMAKERKGGALNFHPRSTIELVFSD